MRVVLASGGIVTASACQNQELFYALRGGGGGTFGIVLETTVKTYPTRGITVARVGIRSRGDDTVPDFLNAVSTVYSAYPGLSESGFSGYGFWAAYAMLGVMHPNYTNVLQQSFTILDTPISNAQTLFLPFEEDILRFNDTGTGVEVSISWQSYPDYGSYYAGKSDTTARVGSVSAISSHLLSSKSLTGNTTLLRQTIDKVAGVSGNPVYHTMVHHGLEVSAAGAGAGANSAVHRGWYDSVILDIFEKAMNGTQASENIEAFAELRKHVAPEYRRLSPTTGVYMNEADWGNVHWQEDFYGVNWQRLSQIKAKYDPDGIFYCQTCVGSEQWVEDEDGALCS